MAKTESTNPGATAPADDYGEWATDTSFRLTEARYLAEAAQAILHQSDATESDEKLMGASYLLTMLAKRCNELALEVGNTEFLFTRKEEIHG